jgi:hypothetical protein
LKSSYRAVLADLRAASALAQPEAIDLALEGVRRLPEISGNQSFNQSLIDQLLLPAGVLLIPPRVPLTYLEKLSQDQLAAIRCLAAAALVPLALLDNQEAANLLESCARDRRPEVRLTVERAMVRKADGAPFQLLALARRWLVAGQQQGVPSMQVTALRALLPLAPSFSAALLEICAEVHACPDEGVKGALVELLVALGNVREAENVLALLQTWAQEPQPNDWVICRTLGAAWAREHPVRAEKILQELYLRTGPTRNINHVRQAFERSASNGGQAN